MQTPLAHDLHALAEARAYSEWLVGRARPWLGGRVLDVGAGIGTHTAAVCDIADQVVALEPDPALAAVLRDRVPQVEVVEGDAGAVEGPFDAIVCFNVLEHIADDEATLRRFHELLRPGGAVCAIVPAHPLLFGSLDRTFAHERRYRRADLQRKLLRARFEIERLEHVNPVGAAAWFVHAKLLRRRHLPRQGVAVFDRLVPLLRELDRLPLPFGLSLWAVARAPA